MLNAPSNDKKILDDITNKYIEEFGYKFDNLLLNVKPKSKRKLPKRIMILNSRGTD